MLYEFRTEDQQFHQFLETLDVLPYLNSFFENHKSRIEKSFEDMLVDMKKEEKTKRDTRFIQEMDCNQFIDVVEFTFEVMFAKDLMRLSTKQNYDTEILFLAAHSLAEKMSSDAQNSTYVEQIERVISNCRSSIMSAYKNAEK